MSPYCAAAAASSTVCCGGRPSITDTSPNWRSPSTSTTGSVDRFAIATATLIAMQVLPTPPLVEKTTIEATGLAGTGSSASAVARVTEPASSSPTRSTDWCRLASPPITTASRAPARSACWRTSVDSSLTAKTAPSSGCAPVSRCTCWKPIGLTNPGPKTATTGRPPDSCWTSSSMVSNCAASASSTASRVRSV